VSLLMDANGTRAHLLLGLDDWGTRCVLVPGDQKLAAAFEAAKSGQDVLVSWNARQELTLGERITIFPTAPANQPPQPSQRRGAAVDELGEIFWISDDEHDVLAARPGEEPSVYWSSRPAAIPCKPKQLGAFRTADADLPIPELTLRGLASLPGGYLVAGALELHGLLVFDVRTGGTPQQLLWPRDVDFEPFDICATAGGGIAVLDAAHARVWQLDRAFAAVAPWLESTSPAPSFRSVEGEPAACEAPPVTAEHSFPTHQDAVGIASLANGSLLVLVSPATAQFSTLHRYREGVERDSFSTALADALIDHENRADFSLQSHDFAAVVRGDEQLVYTVGANGDQAIVFRLTFSKDDVMTAEARPELVTLRLFGGKGLAVGAGTVYYDFGNRWLPLVSQNRGRFQRSATVRVLKLDGKQTDCVWHRLLLEACIPPECDVLVSTRTANDETLLPLSPLNGEPELLRRNEPPHACGLSTWELLFQRAKGRYLQIELTLAGNGRATPRIRALQAQYPRFSYLEHYLPAVYRENAESSSFLDRFLALFEGFFTNIEDRIAAAHLMIDVRSAPSDALEWLAGWFSIAFDESWSDAKRRLFLQHAVEFFEWRGTSRGLLAALGLALEECPDPSLFDFDAPLPRTGVRIQEAFRGRPATAVAEVSAEGLNPPDESDSTWIAHLERTYGSAAALNEKYGTDFESLSQVTATRATAENVARIGEELRRFTQTVTPFQTTAHRFSVFFPLPPGSTDAPQRTDLASRVIRLEKPAHTTFEVDFYWTWFRLGEARLGEGTVVDLGSRSPSLIAPYAVGNTRIGAAYFAPDSTAMGPGRMILGRGCARQPSPSGEMR
jgi:phage tail-like protein